MAYDAALDRDKELKTIFLRPGHNLIADEFDYGTTDIDIYPGMCLDLVNNAKFSSGHATQKGGAYEPVVADYNTHEGQTVLQEWAVSTKIKVRTVGPGVLVSILVGPGTVANYAKGVKLVNQAAVASADVTGLTFNSGVLELKTVSHFQVEVPPAADIVTTGLIVARCIPSVDLSDVA